MASRQKLGTILEIKVLQEMEVSKQMGSFNNYVDMIFPFLNTTYLHDEIKKQSFYGPPTHPRQIERRLDWVFYKTELKIWAVGSGLGWTVLKKVWADY